MGNRQFHAKILLFGEYTILLGSDALAIPLQHFSGNLGYGKTEPSHSDGMQKLFSHVAASPELKNLFLLDQWQQDLDKGLYFPSTIPQGYGLGSSGALVAAAYRQYAIQHTEDIPTLKTYLALMENAFHGASSGMDPLVSYLDLPLLFQHNGQVLPIQHSVNELDKFWLLDTGIARSTSDYVRLFQAKLEQDASFLTQVNELKHKNQEAVSRLIQPDGTTVRDLIFQISSIQFAAFRDFIPADLWPVWEKGLRDHEFYLKLCGAGGGGMMLVYVSDPNRPLTIRETYNIFPINRP